MALHLTEYYSINLLGKNSNLSYCLSMENAKSRHFITPLHVPSSYSIFKRLANLVLVVIGIIICVNLWLISSHQSINWHNKQANQLGKSLSSLSSQILADSMLANDSERLREQLSYIVADPHVLSASLFDEKGRLLAENDSASSVLASYKLSPTTPLVFVEHVMHQEKLVGYLRVMLKEDKVMEYHSEYQKQLYEQVQVLMLLSAIAGILLARAFYKVRYKKLRESKNSPS